jgi:chromate transporter
VGFVGGWTHAIFGTDSLFLAGAVAATVATFFTFLPSFLFIFIGGPLVESTQGNIKFTAPLTGITAAVVGVILNLALFFAYHIIWPHGLQASIDWFSLVASVAAFLALFNFKVGIIRLIIAFGVLGLAHHMLF